MRKLAISSGFTMVELIIVIVVIGIMAGVALETLMPVSDRARVEDTRGEMQVLARAIAGNPDLSNNGLRSDFGYVGDIGSLPPNLEALRTNPGYATWRGPYIREDLRQVIDDFKNDAWGIPYVYSGGINLVSLGSGDTLVFSIANGSADLLQNTVSGNIFDGDGTPPGNDYRDSVTINLIYADGIGGTRLRTVTPDISGFFAFDSIPIGNQELEIIYLPDHDTLKAIASVTPGSSLYGTHKFASDLWHSGLNISGMIAHFPLDEGSGQTAYDVTGQSAAAVLQNDPTGTGWCPGQVAGAFRFDGADDYFRMPADNTSLQLTDDYSASIWIYAESNQNDWAGIFSKCTPSGDDNHWTLQFNTVAGTGKQLTIYHPGGGHWYSTYTLAQCMNAWHHIVITFRRTPARAQLFVDGLFHSETTTLTTAPGSGNGKFHIGAERIQIPFRGRIDDIRIFNRVLTPSEIQILFNYGS